MNLPHWIYIAPQRIRRNGLAFPRCTVWKDLQELNLQRLARVLEFQGCVAFVGSGASCDVGYPRWKELLPADLKQADREALDDLLDRGRIEYPVALQIAAELSRPEEDPDKRREGEQSRSGSLESGRLMRLAKLSMLTQLADKFASGPAKHLADAARSGGGNRNPFDALLELPIRRFITTNYDPEVERALVRLHGKTETANAHELGWTDKKSFHQYDVASLAIFSIALSPENSKMVFHCHGKLRPKVESTDGAFGEGRVMRFWPPEKKKDHLVLTEDDYKEWYLSNERVPLAFRRTLEVLLESNPLLFVGYSLSDADLARVLRRHSLRDKSRYLASNAFALINLEKPRAEIVTNKAKGKHLRLQNEIKQWAAEYGLSPWWYRCDNGAALLRLDGQDRKADLEESGFRAAEWKGWLQSLREQGLSVRITEPSELWCHAQQIKFGINLITYARTHGHSLADELRKQYDSFVDLRTQWRLQPCAQEMSEDPVEALAAAYDGDPLFPAKGNGDNRLGKDQTLTSIKDGLEQGSVVALKGPIGSGKYLKVCQFVRSPLSKGYDPIVFSTYGNEDIYSYLKRIARVASKRMHVPANKLRNKRIVKRLRFALSRNYPQAKKKTAGKTSDTKLLLVISGLERFLDLDGDNDLNGRQEEAQDDNSTASTPRARPKAAKRRGASAKLQATGNHPSLRAAPEADSRQQWEPRNNVARELLRFITEWATKPASDNKILITTRSIPDSLPKQVKRLNDGRPQPPLFSDAELGVDPSDSKNFAEIRWQLPNQQAALPIAAAYVAGVELVDTGKDARRERTQRLLRQLVPRMSEQGTRVVRHVIRALDEAQEKKGHHYEHLLMNLSCFSIPIDDRVIEECVKIFDAPSDPIPILLKTRLLEIVERSSGLWSKRSDTRNGAGKARLYVVPPLVKRYCRVIADASNEAEKRSCGVHGYLSRGPFNNPGRKGHVKVLFERFAGLAYEEIKALGAHRPDGKAHDSNKENLAQNFTRATLDILRSNFSCNSVGQWGTYPEYVDMCSSCLDLLRNLALRTGRSWRPGPDARERAFVNDAVATPEQIIFLYNELGLAYFNEGNIQDALSIWSLAVEWQRVIAHGEEEQGAMYAASLYFHLGMAHMQMGRLGTAETFYNDAYANAQRYGNRDLAVRSEGMLARIEHFRGNIGQANRTYAKVIKELGVMGNLRAQSYFIRHRASLLIRLGKSEQAERLSRLSLAIAASEDCMEFVALSRETLAKVYAHRREPRAAIREYKLAFAQAEQLGILRLKADVLIGLATVQLDLGDAKAALDRGREAMKIANEGLLVLRQIKALVVLGLATAELGSRSLGISYLRHAIRLAGHSEHRLAEHDAEQALARLDPDAKARASLQAEVF